MAITRQQKEVMFSELKDSFQKAKGVVFAQNNGLTVEDFSALRKSLRSKGVKTKVAKKTLMKLAAKEYQLDVTDDILEGPIAVAFSMDDEVAAAQEIYRFAKTHENIKLMGGVFEGKVIGQSMIMQLAQLPSRKELYAKLVGTMKAPISGFYGVTSGVLRGFIQACKQLSEKQT